MIGQKTQMLIAAIAALLLALLLVGISYLLTPDTSNKKPLPMPLPSILNQIFMALLWIGLATLIAFCIVGVALLINRMRSKKTSEDSEAEIEIVNSGSSDTQPKNAQSVGSIVAEVAFD